MSYSIKLVRKAEQNTSNWSGGATTQIAIYPWNAEYSKRNFIWRLSSAKVDLEESTFTSLPGISRVLMVIAGELKLEHEGRHSAYLKPFEQDKFSAGWTTRSYGKASDFNLMTAQGCTGRLTALQIGQQASIATADPAGRSCKHYDSAFYCVDGRVRLIAGNQGAYVLHEGDVLILHSEQQNEKITVQISNLGDKQVHVIRADLEY